MRRDVTSLVTVVGGFAENAKTAMAASPDYFAWWYTVKSVLLVGALGTAAYFAGRASSK